jgi:pimeloyl-ACP methyl ester carboxylesterase
MPSYHFIRAGLLVLVSTVAFAQTPVATPSSSSFTIFLRSVPVGSEQVSVQRTPDGWTITSSSRMGAPVNVVAPLIQIKYTPDWKPTELAIDATVQGEALRVRTAIADGTARGQLTRGTQTSEVSEPVAGDAVLLPSPFWGPFEALAERLRTAAAGQSIPTYLVGSSAQIEVGESTEEAIQTAARLVRVRRTPVKVPVPGAIPLDMELWGDENGRLVRLTIPAQNIDVVREDVASVASRRVVISRAGDEQIRIPANGFTLAGTVSKPTATTARVPAVVLVGGSGPTDRDEMVFGIPIFGQLANALADAGFLVVRYDKRGVGQSGGRPESATLNDFADDLRAVLKLVTDRRDVDRKRVAVIGHSEGAAVAMLAAAKDNRVTALALVGAPGVTGADLNLYQVTHALERSNRPDAEKQATIDLQKKIQTAVLTGSGWDAVPANVRRQADTPWFQSFLAFDPAKPMSDIDQPLMILHGELDTQVPPANADRLETLARSRRNRPVDLVKLPGVNHLLVPAATGEVDEYANLKDKRISAAVLEALAGWLRKTFSAIK